MTELKGAVVIVTGAGRGIGRAHARTLAAHGARVIVNDVAGAHECVERLAKDGLTAWADTSDIGTWDGARSLIGATVDRFGCLDGLVNNAGVLRRADVAYLVEEDLDLELGVNLKGAFACTRFASQYWRQESRAGRRPRLRGRGAGSTPGAGDVDGTATNLPADSFAHGACGSRRVLVPRETCLGRSLRR